MENIELTQVAPVLQDQEHAGRMPRVFALALATSLALSACTGAESSPLPETTPTTATAPATALPTHTAPTAEQIAYNKLPSGPCIIKEQAKDDGKLCAAARKHGSIALVYYDSTSPENAKRIANQTSQLFDTLSKGAFNPTVIPVKANYQAQKALLAESGSAQCIDSSKPEDYSAVLADKAMDLSGYNWVIGLNGKFDCKKKDIGVAEGNHGRYADIFYAGSQLGKYSETFNTYTARVATHEGLHLGGLGHVSTLNCYDPKTGIGYDFYEYKKRHNATNIDLATYVAAEPNKQCDYAEYKAGNGKDDIMGRDGPIYHDDIPSMPPLKTLEPVQLDQLAGPRAMRSHELEPGEAATITRKDDYAIVELERPIVVAKPIDKNPDVSKNLEVADVAKAAPEDVMKFDKIVFEMADNPHGTGDVQIELIREGKARNGVVKLRQVAPDYWKLTNQPPLVFHDGDQDIALSFAEDGFTVAVS